MPCGPWASRAQSYVEAVSTRAASDAYSLTRVLPQGKDNRPKNKRAKETTPEMQVCPLPTLAKQPRTTLVQVSSGGSTFYANGYDDGNKDGWVMMQTVSGVAGDGREVVAVVAPGKYPPGSSVLVEARHVVGKPEGLDWDRAAMFPFLVSVRLSRTRTV